MVYLNLVIHDDEQCSVGKLCSAKLGKIGPVEPGGGDICPLDSPYTRAQNVCPGWPVYEVKQPQEKWACDFHDDAPPLSFQLQVAEVIF